MPVAPRAGAAEALGAARVSHPGGFRLMGGRSYLCRVKHLLLCVMALGLSTAGCSDDDSGGNTGGASSGGTAGMGGSAGAAGSGGASGSAGQGGAAGASNALFSARTQRRRLSRSDAGLHAQGLYRKAKSRVGDLVPGEGGQRRARNLRSRRNRQDSLQGRHGCACAGRHRAAGGRVLPRQRGRRPVGLRHRRASGVPWLRGDRPGPHRQHGTRHQQ